MSTPSTPPPALRCGNATTSQAVRVVAAEHRTINATTGAQLWKYTTAGKVSSSPTVSEEVVYVGSQDNNLYAINARTGVLIWKYWRRRI